MNSHEKLDQSHDVPELHETIAVSDDAASATDPVCGMTVPLEMDKPFHEWGGEKFHFCSESCRDRFVADPFFYVSGNSKNKKQVATEDTTYTCPMHPEIVQDEPGSCPICGMALEPTGGVSDEPNHELIDFTRRLWVSLLAAIPLIILTMGPMVGMPVREWMGERLALLLEFALATPVVVWAAWPFFKRGWTSDCHLEPEHVDADHDRRRNRLSAIAWLPHSCPACFRRVCGWKVVICLSITRRRWSS